MKTCKKTLAIVLSIIMAMSAMVFTASAEDEIEKVPVDVTFSDARVTETDENDDLIVKQIQMKVSEENPAEGADPAVFDTVDTEAEIYVSSTLYASIALGVTADKETDIFEVLDEVLIAKMKPVSCADGVLTLDVYDTQGNVGAKLGKLVLEEMGDLDDALGFTFLIPEGIAQDSAAGKTNNSCVVFSSIEGLKEIKEELPPLVGFVLKLRDKSFAVGSALALILFPFLVASLARYFAGVIGSYLGLYGLNVTAAMIFKLVGMFF